MSPTCFGVIGPRFLHQVPTSGPKALGHYASKGKYQRKAFKVQFRVWGFAKC